MAHFIKRSSKKAGQSPGSLVHIGEKKIEKIKISLMYYDSENLQEKQLPAIEASFPYRDRPPVSWINVDGLHEIDVIEKIGTHFGIHSLVLEDIVNTGQRTKAEEFKNYIFIVFKMLVYDETADHITAEQVSLILGPHFLLSFQEKEGDVFDFVRERVRKDRGRIRKSGSDYLAYALMDAVVDHYYAILERLSDKIELLEDQMLDNPLPCMLADIHHLKRDMIFLRKQVWPLREVLNNLIKDPSELIQETTRIFLRDVYDHTIQVIDTIESFRDVLSGLSDLYQSTVGNRMNEVMKVLTIIATIFIPLSFIAGIYGMNFEYMPELKWHWAYPALWGVLILIFSAMILWFKRKKWL